MSDPEEGMDPEPSAPPTAPLREDPAAREPREDLLERLVVLSTSAPDVDDAEPLASSAAEQVAGPVLVWSVPRRRPVAANRRLALMLGIPAKTLPRARGEAIAGSLHPEDASTLAEAFGELEHPGGGPVEAAFRVQHADGSWRWLQGRFAVVARRRDGRGLLASGVVEDATSRRMLADQLRQAQRMEAVGRLAGGIAHDFNNLLTAIMGSAEMLQRELGAEHRLSAFVDEIVLASDRAASLTHQLLAFSRQQVLRPRVVALADVVGEVRQLLRRLIGEHIEIECHTAPDTGAVRIDPAQLQQVLINLAVNARDAMPHGGTLTIHTRRAEMDDAQAARYPGLQPGCYATIVVRDTGVGMDRDIRARVFEPFFTTKSLTGGTGLGLSTVYGVVKQSRGYVYVDSEPGAGAEFTVFLPSVDEAPEPAASPRAAEPRERARQTVLVVEDDAPVRAIVQETLEHYGYEVIAAERGATALQGAAAHPGAIDLVLTDVILPGISGLEVWNRLRARHPSARVIFMSGYPQGTAGGAPAALEGVEYLPKPFTPGQLAARVRDVLGGD